MTPLPRTPILRRARALRPATAAALLLALAACADAADDRLAPGAATPAADAAPAAAGADPAASGDACRMTGAWQRCSAVESVERAGYRLVLLRDSVAHPGIAEAGAAYRLGSAELQLFVFADSAAAARAAAAIDADDAEPVETRGILRPPAVIRSNNLVALLFDNNDRLRERVQLALAAGLPPA
jgi:hypothetical protein